MNRDELVSIIERAAASEGVPASALLATANLESSGNVNAKNPNSSASGPFQFVDKTAREYGLTGSKRNDPTAQAQAAAKMMATNMRSLTRVLGREPNAGELYLAHQQGLGGATALLRNPNVSAVDALTRVYGSRAKAERAILLNGGSLNMTAGDFSSKWVNKANQTAARIPPGSIPNTVGSELSVTPPVAPRVAPTPAPLSQRPTAQPANIPLPRARPASPMDIASAPGTTVATVPTVQRQQLPPLAPPTLGQRPQSFAGQDAIKTASRKPVPLTIGAQSSFAALEGAKAVSGPSSTPKSQDRLAPSAPGLAPRSALPNKQQVEAATGFRLPSGSPLTEDVEVENPAYAALMKRVQQGEIELRGLTPSGMPLSRDGRARYEASLKALQDKLAAQRAELAKMQPKVTVTRAVRQPVAAPVPVIAQTVVQRLRSQGLSPAAAYDQANRLAKERARANATRKTSSDLHERIVSGDLWSAHKGGGAPDSLVG